MTEQFRIDGSFRNSTTVDSNILSMLSATVLVNDLRETFLTDTTLSGYSTDKSVGATCMATSIARVKASVLPIIPNLSFTCCISAFVIFALNSLPD